MIIPKKSKKRANKSNLVYFEKFVFFNKFITISFNKAQKGRFSLNTNRNFNHWKDHEGSLLIEKTDAWKNSKIWYF